MFDPKEIENRFAFHPASTPEKRGDHTSVRARCMELALFLNDKLPAGRDCATALRKLEEAMFWANAAIAREDARDHPWTQAEVSRRMGMGDKQEFNETRGGRIG